MRHSANKARRCAGGEPARPMSRRQRVRAVCLLLVVTASLPAARSLASDVPYPAAPTYPVLELFPSDQRLGQPDTLRLYVGIGSGQVAKREIALLTIPAGYALSLSPPKGALAGVPAFKSTATVAADVRQYIGPELTTTPAA